MRIASLLTIKVTGLHPLCGQQGFAKPFALGCFCSRIQVSTALSESIDWKTMDKRIEIKGITESSIYPRILSSCSTNFIVNRKEPKK